jgi:hypothetical protein
MSSLCRGAGLPAPNNVINMIPNQLEDATNTLNRLKFRAVDPVELSPDADHVRQVEQ